MNKPKEPVAPKGVDIDALRTQYQDNFDRAKGFQEFVVTQLSSLLVQNDATLGVPIESRVKTWSSIAEKLERKQISLDSLFALHDLIGVRLILLFRSDLSKVLELIKNTFEIISDEDTATRLGDAEFGYRSHHFVVRLPKQWLSLPTSTGFGDFYVELQVRTLAQHMWAAASHKLQYKQELGVPRPVRRAINRVSALLETVDLEFERVLEQRELYLLDVKALKAETEPLNVDSLSALLSELLPPQNKGGSERYADLLFDLTMQNVKTPQRLREILTKHAEKAISAERKCVEILSKAPQSLLEPQWQERVSRGVIFDHVEMVRIAVNAEQESGVFEGAYKLTSHLHSQKIEK